MKIPKYKINIMKNATTKLQNVFSFLQLTFNYWFKKIFKKLMEF